MTPKRLADPAALLEVLAARDACRHAELALRHSVSSARRAGHAWSAVGTVVGTTRQAAQQHFDDADRSSNVPSPIRNKEVINRS